jgi:uncharacterized repeat protein (TIGR01451 family)
MGFTFHSLSKNNFLFSIIVLFSFFSFSQTTRNIPAGSVIINMGVTPQTVGNSLKPYGLVYNLIAVQKVPVLWSINPTKARDGIDFTVDGLNFKNSAFIIEKQYVSTPVLNAINAYKVANPGVITYTTLTSATIPLYKEIVEFPSWVLDTANGFIARNYLINAGIPSTAYRSALPSALTTCDDLFILPHADPTWATHGRLYSWNNSVASGGSAGWIWEACHSVSVMEGLVNPLNPAEKLNFLGNDPLPGLLNYNIAPIHVNGIGPYSYSNPNDPTMQFLGNMDAATQNGSERVYLPKLGAGGGWRATTTVSVWDPLHPNLAQTPQVSPLISSGRAAKIAYGYAFGDITRGKVMYEGGHNHNTGSVDDISAQRAMLNFSFDAPAKKGPTITTLGLPVTEILNGATTSLSISAVSGSGSALLFQWSSSCGGSFSSPTSASTNFTAPIIAAGSPNINCNVTISVTDSCNRVTFTTYPITIIAPAVAPVANNDSFSTYTSNALVITPLANDTDLNNNINPATISNLSPLSVLGGTFNINLDGTITFTPAVGFVGTATLNYRVCDTTTPVPLCSNTATITVNVFASPCPVGQIASSSTAYGAAVVSSTTWNLPANAIGAPDALGSNSNSATGSLIIDLGFTAVVGTQIKFKIFSSNGNNITGATIDASTTTTFPVSPISGISTIAPLGFPDTINYTVAQANTRYVRITAPNNFGLESITFSQLGCITPTADLKIEKTINNLTPLVGETVVFTLIVTNLGPNIATGVIANDLLSSHYTHVSNNGGEIYNPVNGNWTIGTLAVGSSTTLQIAVIVNP